MAARKPDIQYIHYQIDGSAARQLEPKRLPERIILPSPKRKQQQKPQVELRVDPLVAVGVLVAAVMLVLILVGSAQLTAVRQQAAQMESYVATLTEDHIRMQEQYNAGCDLEDVEVKALALGMIPVEQAQHIAITLPVHEPEVEPTFWEQLVQDWKNLFA